jgi:hypothetical protein
MEMGLLDPRNRMRRLWAVTATVDQLRRLRESVRVGTVRAKPEYRYIGTSQMYEFQRASMSNAPPRSAPVPSRTAAAAAAVAIAVAAPQRLTAHLLPVQVAPRPTEGNIVVDP